MPHSNVVHTPRLIQYCAVEGEEGKKGDSGDYRGIAFNASRLKGVLLLLLLLLEDLDV